MQFSTLLLEQYQSTLIIYLNRPDKLNALNATMLSELEQVFSDASLASNYRSIVISGKGKAFAAGADIAELSQCTADSGEAFARRGQRVFSLIEQTSIPVIAAVNGYALGGGCELAMACHLRFAATNAVFGQPEIKLGIIPGYGGTQRFSRIIGIAKATEYLLTGEQISAEHALTLGLVNRLYPSEVLLSETLTFCSLIEKMPPLAVAAILRCTYGITNYQLDVEAREFGQLCGTEDFHEGTHAFLEKRQPQFRGR
jgi:enoyl-CoA hydratase